ncbi:MAG: lactate utilization protein [Oscillospiraceae bacterium]|nr:lactate utilization protein [Oscillospiraceae bacterium]
MEKLELLAKVLERKGFRVALCETRAEARELLLSEINEGETVGIGGSVTIRELDILDALSEKDCTVHWHWLSMENAFEIRKLAGNSDVYLCSSNAVTETGELVNIDGTGNRVAAMFYGPGRSIVVVSKNKIAPDFTAAVNRIKELACPKNATRLGLDTPCAKTGVCSDCSSKSRMCNVMTVISNPPGGRDFYIVLVNEDMGY